MSSLKFEARIDYTEFLAAAMERSVWLKEELCWEAFRSFDTDGDGVISRQELAQLLTADDLNSALKSTGGVSFEETPLLWNERLNCFVKVEVGNVALRTTRGDHHIAEVHVADAIERLSARTRTTLSTDTEPKKAYVLPVEEA